MSHESDIREGHDVQGSITQAYRESIEADDTDEFFSLAYQWQDKAYRHVWDLCALLDDAHAERDRLAQDLADIRKRLDGASDSVLTGATGLAAATYRQAMAVEDRRDARVDELEAERDRLAQDITDCHEELGAAHETIERLEADLATAQATDTDAYIQQAIADRAQFLDALLVSIADSLGTAARSRILVEPDVLAEVQDFVAREAAARRMAGEQWKRALEGQWCLDRVLAFVDMGPTAMEARREVERRQAEAQRYLDALKGLRAVNLRGALEIDHGDCEVWLESEGDPCGDPPANAPHMDCDCDSCATMRAWEVVEAILDGVG